MRTLLLVLPTLLALSGASAAGPQKELFDDPLFRDCISWMLDGQRGALIENQCIDEYGIPPPSLFLCARKAQTGFASPADREACAIVYEEEVKKVRASHIK